MRRRDFLLSSAALGVALLPAVEGGAQAQPRAPSSFGAVLMIDAWDFATITPTGRAPDERLKRATWRSVQRVGDKLSPERRFAASGDVRHTRPDEEPFCAIDEARGRRALWFVASQTDAAYLTIPPDALSGFSFGTASRERPSRLTLALRLRAGSKAANGASTGRTGDGALFDRGGWRAGLSPDLRTITFAAPRAGGAQSASFAFPMPEEGFLRLWMELAWDGSDFAFYLNGEPQRRLSASPGVGAYLPDSAAPMTLGGAERSGVEFECDFCAAYSGASQTAAIADWREATPTPMSWGSTSPYFLGDCDDIYYSTFLGDDGQGLKPIEHTLLTDKGDEGEFWKCLSPGKANRLVISRVRGANVRQQLETQTRYIGKITPHLVVINASGGAVAAVGTEMRFTHNGQANRKPATSWAHHIIFKGIGAGGPMSLFSEFQGEGTPFMILGEAGKNQSAPADMNSFLFKDCWTAFTPDNGIGVYYHSRQTYFQNLVCLASLRLSNHPESPGHDFVALVGDGARQASFLNLVALNFNQRNPTVLGSHGDDIAAVEGSGESLGGLSIPQNDGSRSYGGASFGQTNHDPGARTKGAHLSIVSHVFAPNRRLGMCAIRIEKQADLDSPSTLFGLGNVLRAGSSFVQNSETAAAVTTHPKWGGGGRHLPITEQGLTAVAERSIARLPGFVSALYRRYRSGEIVTHDRLTRRINLRPSLAGALPTLLGAQRADLLNYSLTANAALEPSMDGQVRPWGDIPNGAQIAALVRANKPVPGPMLWPLVAPLLFS